MNVGGKEEEKNNELGLGERKPWTAEGQGVLIEQGTALLAHRKAQIVRGYEERHHNEDLPRADGFLAKERHAEKLATRDI